MTARLIRIEGRVQGVFFRDWTVGVARSLGLSGWVRNRRDGSVEALAIGDEAAIARLIALCHEGPPHAAVDRVSASAAAVEILSGFSRRPTA